MSGPIEVEKRDRGRPPGSRNRPPFVDDSEPENRDNKKINYDQVTHFGKVNLCVEDMACILGITTERVQRLMSNPKSRFYVSYKRGQALTRLSLLHTQLATAYGDKKGNASLLMHLGSVILGQQSVAKRTQDEEQDESAESILQNVSAAEQAQMYNVLLGNTEKEVEVNDGDQ